MRVGKYISAYQKDYFSQPWFERDFMTYIDHLKYQECVKESANYFEGANVVNFDIIQNRCRGDQFEKSLKEHVTVYRNDFVNYSDKN